MRILNFNISRVQDQDKPTPEQAKIMRRIVEKQILRTRQDIGKWRNALTQAEAIENPQRLLLYTVYNEAMLDAHLTSIIFSRKNKALSKPFKIVSQTGEEVPEKTALLESEWFYRILDLALDSIFYGHSLIQLGDIVEDQFSSVELVPRHHVKPELGIVVENPGDEKGESYLEPPFSEWLISVGDSRNLGLLKQATPLTIWSKNAAGAWSEYQELFGMPMRIGRTNTRDENMRKNMEDMLDNMGRAAWGVFDTNDVVELVQASGSIGNPVFQTMIETMDSRLSKLIYGQTMTSDNGSSRSQAEVHQSTADDFTGADLRWLQFLVNGKILPLLDLHGFGFKGLKFIFDHTERISKIDQFTIDSKLLDYYKIKPQYITDTYGTPVEDKPEPEIPDPGKQPTDPGNISNVKKRLREYYE
jgi:hypothetical protein